MNANSRERRGRIVLALILAIAVGVFWYWQTPGDPLEQAEIEHYLQAMDAGLPMPSAEKAEFITRLRSWAHADDGKPVHMLNLIRFHDSMPPVPGHPEFSGTAQEANAHYEQVVMPLLVARGVYPVFASTTQGLGEGSAAVSNLLGFEEGLDSWHRVMLVRYPTRRAFLDLASDHTYFTVVPFKLAAIDLGFVPLDKQYMLPDLRWIVALAGIGVFLGFTALQNRKYR